MAFSLLQTKLFIPPVHHLLPRPHLIQKLEEGRKQSHHLFLISSSAGSGKTSLLSTWAAQHPTEFAWVSLDEGDNEPNRFWRYIIAALQRIQPGLGQEAAALLDSPQTIPTQTILIALLNELANHPTPVMLVLDDYHTISNAEIHSGVIFFLDHLSPQVSLVTATRADPPLPIVRLRAHNELTEIRETNLRFSAEEASAFLESMGLHLSKEDILAIETRTEGWIAGLQLVGLAFKVSSSSQNQPDPHAFIDDFKGSNQYILEYLAEEVLTHLDQGIQDFLLKTSITERMCAGLCAEIVRHAEGNERACQSILNDLERANLFTIPLDQEHDWYRYHHLFADLLSHRLQETFTTREIQELHCRASVWLARNGLSDEAIRHALLGKDFETAAGLIEPLARSMMFSGRVNALKNWIQELPEICLQNHLHLKLFGTWIDLLQGICELSKQKIQETEQLIQSLPPSPENNQLKVEMMVILCRFIAISGNTTKAIQIAQETLAVLAEDDLASRARIQSALAIAYGLNGDLERSEAAFKECFQLARASGYYSLAAHTTMLVALGNAHYGRLREPARYLQEVIDLGTQSGQQMFYPAGQGYIGLASIYLEWNDLETAGKLLDQGIELCSQAGLDGVFSGRVLKARLLQAKGDLTGALEEIQSVEKTFQRKDQDTASRQVQILLKIGAIDTASQWITPLKAILNADPAAPQVPPLFQDVLKITLARILLARGEVEATQQLLEAILPDALSGKRTGHLIEVNLLKAMVLSYPHGEKITPTALRYFEQALELAEPEGYVLLFSEMGAEILPLIQAIIQHPKTSERIKRHAALLQSAFGKNTPAALSPQSAVNRSEPQFDLSQREVEILRLIGEGYSNQEIAERLVITLHTVKKHSSHIFSKLGVTSRTQAIAKARQAGWL